VVLAIFKLITANVATTSIVGIVAALCPSLAIRTAPASSDAPSPPTPSTENTEKP
jgi:hypothetical protein